jgi:hypothetical protein
MVPKCCLLAALALGASACAPRMTVGGSLRGDILVPDAGATQQAVRADLRAAASAPLNRGRVDIEAVPTVVVPTDAVSSQRAFVRGRAAFVPDVRARLAPSLALSAERGTTRASDVAADPAEPRPASATLTAERMVVDAGLRTRLGAASAFTIAGAIERSGGVAADAAVLPRLSRSEIGMALSVRGPGRSELGGFFKTGSTTVSGARPWQALSLGAQWRVPLGPGGTVAVDGGVMRGQDCDETGASLHPTASVRFQQSARGPRPGIQVALDRRAEPDRLDGTVRDRHRVALSIETAAVSTVSIRGTVQGLADAGSEAPRRALGVDAVVRVRISEDRSMEYGVAHLVQSLGAGATRGETRLTVAIRSALLGGPCRNSC